jgi:hypothetical protein
MEMVLMKLEFAIQAQNSTTPRNIYLERQKIDAARSIVFKVEFEKFLYTIVVALGGFCAVWLFRINLRDGLSLIGKVTDIGKLVQKPVKFIRLFFAAISLPQSPGLCQASSQIRCCSGCGSF